MSQTLFNGLIEVGNSHVLMPELQVAFSADTIGPEFPLLAPSFDSVPGYLKNPSDVI